MAKNCRCDDGVSPDCGQGCAEIRERARYRLALENITLVLGPNPIEHCTENKCAGCLHEMNEALRLATEALSGAEDGR